MTSSQDRIVVFSSVSGLYSDVWLRLNTVLYLKIGMFFSLSVGAEIFSSILPV
ncbi:MAG: hypothetical protein ACYC49_06825 [Ignavibacteriaceae bacterium]